MADYYTMNDGYVQRATDLALIPPTEENADYVQYLADVANGATVEPFDYDAEAARQAAARPPLSVSPWQIRKALNQTGMRSAVENYVSTQASLNERDGWEHATEFREDDPLLVAAAAALGADLHALLVLASTL